jgi:hypothetical protein
MPILVRVEKRSPSTLYLVGKVARLLNNHYVVLSLFLNEPPHLDMKFMSIEIASSHQTMDSTLMVFLVPF